MPAGGDLTEVKLSQYHQLIAYGLACGAEQQACVVRNMQTGRTTREGQNGMASWEGLTSPLHPLVVVGGGDVVGGAKVARCNFVDSRVVQTIGSGCCQAKKQPFNGSSSSYNEGMKAEAAFLQSLKSVTPSPAIAQC